MKPPRAHAALEIAVRTINVSFHKSVAKETGKYLSKIQILVHRWTDSPRPATALKDRTLATPSVTRIVTLLKLLDRHTNTVPFTHYLNRSEGLKPCNP